jgi:hypothetical protein
MLSFLENSKIPTRMDEEGRNRVSSNWLQLGIRVNANGLCVSENSICQKFGVIDECWDWLSYQTAHAGENASGQIKIAHCRDPV